MYQGKQWEKVKLSGWLSVSEACAPAGGAAAESSLHEEWSLPRSPSCSV